MTEYKMLGETICYCSSCKLDLNHRIILMDGEEPSRVLCLTCNKEHKFRSKAPKKKSTPTRQTATASEKARARQSSEETEWLKKLNDPNVTPVRYHINESFKLDSLVYHEKFGNGLVIGFDYPEKIHVFFDEGVKILKGKKSDEQPM